MKSLQINIIAVLVLFQLSVFAQCVSSYSCSSNSNVACGFPIAGSEAAYTQSYETEPNAFGNRYGYSSSFEINGCFYRDDQTGDRIYDNTLAENPHLTGSYQCRSTNGTDIYFVKAWYAMKQRTIGTPIASLNSLDLKIYRKNGNTWEEVQYETGSDIDDKNFIPQEGNLYKLVSNYSLSDNSSFTNYMYLCFGGGSGGGSYQPVISLVDPNCGTKKIKVENPKLGYTYYWTKDANQNFTIADQYKFNFNSSNELVSQDLNESGLYYVKGYLLDANQSELDASQSVSISVDIIVVPAAPEFRGKLAVCACKTSEFQLSISNSEVGKELIWLYNENGNLLEFQRSDFLSYEDYQELKLLNNPGVYVFDPIGLCYSEITPLPDLDFIQCDCRESFKPTPGKYVISAWVKEEGGENAPELVNHRLSVEFESNGQLVVNAFKASGPNIDGWRRISQVIDIPSDVSFFTINLSNIGTNVDVFFDDIRFQPFNSSMVSYVYDSETFQLVAELDDNNFKTEYIYDYNGNLIRTNVETEDGVRTVSESRSNIKVRP